MVGAVVKAIRVADWVADWVAATPEVVEGEVALVTVGAAKAREVAATVVAARAPRVAAAVAAAAATVVVGKEAQAVLAAAGARTGGRSYQAGCKAHNLPSRR